MDGKNLLNKEIESDYIELLTKILSYQKRFKEEPTISFEKIKHSKNYKRNTIDVNVTHTW